MREVVQRRGEGPGAVTRAEAVETARSVASAAQALVAQLESGGSGVAIAVDRLEGRAAAAVQQPIQGFDAEGAGPSVEDVMASVVAQLGVGTTLLAAETATSGSGGTARLQASVVELGRTADAVEAAAASGSVVQGFDVRPGGKALSVMEAALAALAEMTTVAANVVTTILDKTLKPLLDRVPKDLLALGDEFGLDVQGRLARWGVRAVRRALDLLQSLVSFPAVERVRGELDVLLDRLGRGEDAAAIVSWAIGADTIRQELARTPPGAETSVAEVDALAVLAAGFARICRHLRRAAMLLVGLAAALALFTVTVPHAAALTAGGLVLVLSATVLIGRDYTGASDLPGPIHGIRPLLLSGPDGRG